MAQHKEEDGFEMFVNGEKMIRHGFGPNRMPRYYSVQPSGGLTITIPIPATVPMDSACVLPEATIKTEDFEVNLAGNKIMKDDREWRIVVDGRIIGAKAKEELQVFVSHPGIGQGCLAITTIDPDSGYYLLPEKGEQWPMKISPIMAVRFEIGPERALFVSEGSLKKPVIRCLRLTSTGTWKQMEAPGEPFLSIRPQDWQHMPRLSAPAVQWEEHFYMPLAYKGDGLYEVAHFNSRMLPAGAYELGVRLPKDPKFNFGHAALHVLPRGAMGKIMREVKGMISGDR